MSTPFNKIVACNVRFFRQEKGLTTDDVRHDIVEIYARRTILLAEIDQGNRSGVVPDLTSLLDKINSSPHINRLERYKTEFYLHWCKADYSALLASLHPIEIDYNTKHEEVYR